MAWREDAEAKVPARRRAGWRAGSAWPCAPPSWARTRLPPEFAGRADDYIAAVCAMLPRLLGAGPGRCGRRLLRDHRFHAAQTRRVFDGGTRAGPPVKLHAEQLSDSGGAELAGRLAAR
jgi:imidazolonepropionase-like amidohydrolase